MACYSDDELQRLKANTSLVNLCRSRGIELKKHGRKDLIGPCPFHKDENPSFVVTPEKNLFHCLGCGAAGSVIDFVMKQESLPFKEAVDNLLGSTSQVHRASQPRPKPKPTIQPDVSRHNPVKPDVSQRNAVKLERAKQLFERIITIYEKNLTDSPEGKDYLAHRGMEDAGLFTHHRIGYCNGRLKEILPTGGQVLDELHALGILLDDHSERFMGCLVFPVYDVDGELVTLYGRYTNDGLKRHLFLPDRPTGLWNFGVIRTYSDILLVESVLDALSLEVAGYHNVLSIQGTNGLKDSDVKLFVDYGVQSLTLLLDGDGAGQRAARKIAIQWSEVSGQRSVEVKTLPDEHDPNSYLKEHGAKALQDFLALESEEATDDTSTQPCGPCGERANLRRRDDYGGERQPEPARTPTLTLGRRHYHIHGLEKGPHKLKVTVRVEHAGRLHVDTLDLYSARARRTLAQDLCRVFEEVPETIEADIVKLLKHCEQLDETSQTAAQKPETVKVAAQDKKDAENFGERPDLIELILDDFEVIGLKGERANKLLGYLSITSRKMDSPLSVLILSSSGAGKTALQDACLSLCPPEDVVKLTSLSGKALFYKDELSLKHKVLALEEGAGAQEASYAIRNLISAGELVIESTIKDLGTGRLTTMENRVEGPTTVFITTTNPNTDPETRSRFWITSVDESREQTRAILAFQRQRRTLEGMAEHHQIDDIRTRHHNFQRLLKPLMVVNPFAEKLTYGDDRLQGRRDQPKYLNLIHTVAFLRQMQKNIKTQIVKGQTIEYIEADHQDVRLANKLAREILGSSLDELSRPSRDLLAELQKMLTRNGNPDSERESASEIGTSDRRHSFTRREIREFTGWSNYRVHTHLRELIEFEVLAVETDRLTNGHRYRLLWDGQGKEGDRFMPGLSDVEELEPSFEGGSACGTQVSE